MADQHAHRRDTVVVVLAAGRGTRFGSTKQLASVDGIPMVRRVVDTAVASAVGRVVVVVGHDGDAVTDALPDGVEVVQNPDHATGQASSVATGLAAAETLGAETVVVLLADEPTMTAEAIRIVADSVGDAPVTRALWDDGPGHPVRLERSVWAEVRALEGDVGARTLDVATTTVRVSGRRPRDVDRPSDLAGDPAGER